MGRVERDIQPGPLNGCHTQEKGNHPLLIYIWGLVSHFATSIDRIHLAGHQNVDDQRDERAQYQPQCQRFQSLRFHGGGICRTFPWAST